MTTKNIARRLLLRMITYLAYRLWKRTKLNVKNARRECNKANRRLINCRKSCATARLEYLKWLSWLSYNKENMEK